MRRIGSTQLEEEEESRKASWREGESVYFGNKILLGYKIFLNEEKGSEKPKK